MAGLVPYLMHKFPDDEKPVYVSLKQWTEMFDVGMNHAVEMLADKRANPGRRGAAAAKPLKELGEHPEEGGPVNVLEGRYGPYVKWGKVNATIPKEVEPADVTMEMAVGWIAEKAAKKKPRPQESRAEEEGRCEEKGKLTSESRAANPAPRTTICLT